MTGKAFESILCFCLSDACHKDGCGTLLLDLLCANIRNCIQPSSVLQGLDLVIALLPYLTDDIKLDRLAPYLTDLLQNEQAPVRAHSLKTLTHTVSSRNNSTRVS